MDSTPLGGPEPETDLAQDRLGGISQLVNLGEVEPSIDDISLDAPNGAATLPDFSNWGSDAQSSSAAASTPNPMLPQKGDWDTLTSGATGDCYFNASLVEVAKNDPQEISNLIHKDANGEYTVDFYGQKPVTVNGDGLSDGNSANGDWAQTLEQAWETTQGNVKNNDANDEGGVDTNALHALTGQNFSQHSVNQGSINQAIQDIKAGDDVEANTSGIKNPKNGLVSDHEYSILNTDKNGDIELRNAWGDDPATNPEPAGKSANDSDGTFWMTQKQFSQDFSTVTDPTQNPDLLHQVINGIGNGVEDLGKGVEDLGKGIGKGAVSVFHEGKKLLSDLNPF